jgi:DNA-directed RNA polymerase sigma subunit (sigma70/sigma32)
LNWKQTAAEELKDYGRRKESLTNIPERIRQINAELSSIKSAMSDSTPVKGGGNHREDHLIELIMMKGELEENLVLARRRVRLIERGLNGITEQERKILDMFYISRQRNYISRLCEELGYEERNIYKLKDAALRKYVLAMYGSMDP